MASSKQTLPTRVRLLGWGRNESTNGSVIVDDLTAKVFSANQRIIGRERVPVDFEHNTVPGTPEYERSFEPRPVAGHSTLVCIPREGIFAEAITYTADGERSAINYPAVSVAPFVIDNRVMAAHSWALTHTGAAYGMGFRQADAALTTLSAIVGSPAIQSARLVCLRSLGFRFAFRDARKVDLSEIFQREWDAAHRDG